MYIAELIKICDVVACVHTDHPGAHAKRLFFKPEQIFNALFLLGFPILNHKSEYPAIPIKENLSLLLLKLL